MFSIPSHVDHFVFRFKDGKICISECAVFPGPDKKWSECMITILELLAAQKLLEQADFDTGVVTLDLRAALAAPSSSKLAVAVLEFLNSRSYSKSAGVKAEGMQKLLEYIVEIAACLRLTPNPGNKMACDKVSEVDFKNLRLELEESTLAMLDPGHLFTQGSLSFDSGTTEEETTLAPNSDKADKAFPALVADANPANSGKALQTLVADMFNEMNQENLFNPNPPPFDPTPPAPKKEPAKKAR